MERECSAFQVFCGNPRAWATRRRTPDEIAAFRRERRDADLSPLAVHACYLINPCASDRSVFDRSVTRLAHELSTAARIGAELYVLHPGSAGDRPPARGVRRAARAIARAAERAGRCPCLLLEDTASLRGLGGSFKRLGELVGELESAAPHLNVGLALDSCHAFAAGYDLRDRAEVDRLVEDADAAAGISRVRLIHANDSRDPCGSGRDRHWHIGRGTIGEKGLRNLLCHTALDELPVIMETPWESAEVDLENLNAVRRLIGEPR